jgi:hypothetical protein
MCHICKQGKDPNAFSMSKPTIVCAVIVVAVIVLAIVRHIDG